MKKHKKDIIWEVIEKPTNNVIAQFFFEEDAFKLVKFQIKTRCGSLMVAYQNSYG
jgi:hypothetical protein